MQALVLLGLTAMIPHARTRLSSHQEPFRLLGGGLGDRAQLEASLAVCGIRGQILDFEQLSWVRSCRDGDSSSLFSRSLSFEAKTTQCRGHFDWFAGYLLFLGVRRL